jgi:hypothetical protein
MDKHHALHPDPRENFITLYTSTRAEMDKIMQRIIQIENILYTNVNLEVDLDIATDTYRAGVTEGEPSRKRCKM